MFLCSGQSWWRVGWCEIDSVAIWRRYQEIFDWLQYCHGIRPLSHRVLLRSDASVLLICCWCCCSFSLAGGSVFCECIDCLKLWPKLFYRPLVAICKQLVIINLSIQVQILVIKIMSFFMKSSKSKIFKNAYSIGFEFELKRADF